MKTKTSTVRFNAPKEKVFSYLSDIENLPKWATGFCKSMRKENDDYIVTTKNGDAIFRLSRDETTGVVDMHAGPTPDMMMTWPTRVFGLPDGSSLLTFTMVQTPEMSDEEVTQQCAELKSEFENIRSAVE